MDIQKLEKFEDWFATRYPNVQKTIDLHNDHESIVFRNNQAEAWQAAKAQAVPEGFVLVSQKELLELVIAINAVDLATHTEGKPNEVREMWQQVALKLGAVCSTGASQ